VIGAPRNFRVGWGEANEVEISKKSLVKFFSGKIAGGGTDEP
jgi:hypothetical protein